MACPPCREGAKTAVGEVVTRNRGSLAPVCECGGTGDSSRSRRTKCCWLRCTPTRNSPRADLKCCRPRRRRLDHCRPPRCGHRPSDGCDDNVRSSNAPRPSSRPTCDARRTGARTWRRVFRGGHPYVSFVPYLASSSSPRPTHASSCGRGRFHPRNSLVAANESAVPRSDATLRRTPG